MSRPSRRAKQRQISNDIVGLLPEEEAALTKALYASLHKQGSPDKNSSKDKDKQVPPCLGEKRRKQSNNLGTKRNRLEQNYDYSSSDSFNSDITGSPSLPWQRSECKSPSIYGQSHSSPYSAPSSPISFDSPGGSMRLVLSSTSWSDSPSQSSSIWSPGPSSPRATPKKIKKVVRAKNSSAGKGKGKASPSSPSIDEILLHVSQEWDKSLGKVGTSSMKSKTASADKTRKQKAGNKLKIKSGGKSGSGGKLHKMSTSKELKPNKTTPHNNNNNKAGRKKNKESTVVDDVTVSNKEEVNVESESRNEGSSHTSPCTYQAQRKFASNHTPPRRPPSNESENLASLHEVPKTEDFITFLCLRGAQNVPPSLHKFQFPWTPYQKPKKNGRIRNDTTGKAPKGRSVSKRLLFTPGPSSGQVIQNATVRPIHSLAAVS